MKKGKIFTDGEKRKKARLHKKLRNIGILLLLSAIGSAAFIYSTSQPTEYRVVKVLRGNVGETVEASGDIISKETKTYYAQINAPVSILNAETGKEYKKGDVLAEFDSTDLELAAKQSELAQKAAQGRVSALTQQNEKNSTIYSGAGVSLEVLNQQIADQIENIRAIQEKLTKAEIKASDIATLTNRVNMEIDQDKKEDLQKTLDGWKADYNAYNVPFLSGELVAQQTVLNDLMSSRSEYEAWQKTADASIAAGGNTQEAAANKEAAALTKEDALSTLEQAAAGIVADFNGIVTNTFVEEGATVTEGMPLFKLENRDALTAKVMISKYDIGKVKTGQTAVITIAGNSYEGTVSEISRVATTDGAEKSKIAVEVDLINPDEAVYIGIEADVSIDTGTSENTLFLPIEAVYVDDSGSYCYAIEQGVITRKDIQTGFENAQYLEVVEGVAEGDTIILDAVTDSLIGKKAIEEKE